MYLGVGDTPVKASELSSAAFRRAAQQALATRGGPFAVVAMSPDLTVDVVGEFATRELAQAASGARVSAADDAYVGLLEHDEDAPSGWWFRETHKVTPRSLDWKFPALAGAAALAALWFLSRRKRR
jgi:hypothetical protein